MKILFINISDIRGGASILAYNLGSFLEKHFHTQNLFLVRDKWTEDKDILPTRNNVIEAKIEWAMNILFNTIGLQYKYLPFSPIYIMRLADKFKPDVISLHNPIGGYFRINDLIPLSRIAPIIWTLHDMWAITGNAAHTFGNENWKHMRVGPNENKVYPAIGLNTGNWLLKEKKRIYENSRLRVIAPSSWMYENAKQSPVFKGKKVDLIHHGIDLKLFNPLDKGKIRDEFNIPINQKVLLYSAEKLSNNQFKGGADFQDILLKLDRMLTEKVTLIVIGKGGLQNINLQNIEIKNTGYIFDKKKLISYYSAADVFVYPTKADSFGLVLLESIACGTPCITYKIGGCSDIIKDNISGVLIEPFNTTQFAEQIRALLMNSDLLNSLKKSCRSYAKSKFSLESMAAKYYKIFQEEISN